MTIHDVAGHRLLVDDEDDGLVLAHSWQITARSNGRFYAMTGFRGRTTYLHRLVMAVDDPRLDVDHWNRNGLDCRRVNLRISTRSQNLVNGTSRKGGTSRFKGVSWDSRSRRWEARHSVAGRGRFLGYFADEEEAARAYDAAVIAEWGDFARPNFLPVNA